MLFAISIKNQTDIVLQEDSFLLREVTRRVDNEDYSSVIPRLFLIKVIQYLHWI